MNDMMSMMAGAAGGSTPTLMDYLNSIRVTADVGGGTVSFGDSQHMQKKAMREYLKSLTGQPSMVPGQTPTPTTQTAFRLMQPAGMRMGGGIPTMQMPQQGFLNMPGLREMNSIPPGLLG